MMNKKPQIKRTEKISFTFNGQVYHGHLGETVAAALLREGVSHLRNAPGSNTPRGMFCGMGICQECVVEIDGKRIESCRTEIESGMDIIPVKYGGMS